MFFLEEAELAGLTTNAKTDDNNNRLSIFIFFFWQGPNKDIYFSNAIDVMKAVSKTKFPRLQCT